MLTEWLLVLLGIALTAGTAVFVASEFSLVTLDPGLVERQQADDARGRAVLRALRRLSTQLSGAQVGITLTTVLLGYTTQPAVARLLGVPLEASGLGRAAVGALSAVLALVVVNGFSMLFGELVPKNFAIARPLGTARLVAPLQVGFTTGLAPVITVTNGTANAILRRAGIEPVEELSGARSPAELASLVRRSAEQGTLDAATATLLTNSIAFSDLTAVDVMTDRTRLHVVRRDDDTAADVMALARRTGHSRFPVIGDSSDDVVGLVHLRKAMAVPHDKRADVPAAALMVEAPRVPETVGLGPLLVELRAQGLQMAVVVDEYGGTSGLVTLEDVVEELVGEVADEHDRTRVSAARGPDGSWLLPGVTRPDELAEATGLRVPDDGPYETLGGLLMARLGRVPVEGDEVVVDAVHLRVARMSGRRVERVRVRAVPEAEDGGPR